MISFLETSRTHSRPATLPSFGRLVSRALVVHRTRRALATLDHDRLRDIGLTRAQADAEAARPLWDVPSYWLRETR